MGSICDMGNSYYFSNWGGIGLCRAKPELNVKPSFVSVATMTRVLDGAKFVRVVPLGSPSLYGLEFQQPDWQEGRRPVDAARGKRTVRLLVDRAGDWSVIDDQGAEPRAGSEQGGARRRTDPVAEVSHRHRPDRGMRYSHGGQARPEYADKPAGKSSVLSTLADLGEWTIEANRDPELEYYEFLCPRRKGDFAFEPTAGFEGKDKVLKVTPLPIQHGKEVMPMYQVLAHKKGIPVPGTPTEIGRWVNGNSAWGRLIFEFVDASGRRLDLARRRADRRPARIRREARAARHAVEVGQAGRSTTGTPAMSSASARSTSTAGAGWPSRCPVTTRAKSYPWAANSQWRWDKDGVVHYPLTFERLIVELNEKVLHVKTFAPPPRSEIYLRDLSVGQDERHRGTCWGRTVNGH